MGLDIYSHSRLHYVGHHDERPDGDEHYEQHIHAYAYEAFPHALLGIPDVRMNAFADGESFLDAGCFERTVATREYNFRAGSYGGYNAWRHDLAEQFNPYRDNGQKSPNPEGPFYELLWFAGNEGTIAELAAISLLTDFRQFEAEYRAVHDEYAVDGYMSWMRACELAADGGLIQFC